LLCDVLEDYKDADDILEKQKIIEEFKTELWNSRFKFKTFIKHFSFTVDENLLNNEPDLINLFTKYQVIDVRYCKSFHKNNISSIDYIRIHINNMYGFLVNKDTYLPKEYYWKILKPKHLYYEVVRDIKDNKSINYQDVDDEIKNALSEAEEIKNKYIKERKLNIKWSEYKKIINQYIERIFINYSPARDYTKDHEWKLKVFRENWSEDNYAISYICKSLTGYIRNYIKDQKRDKHKYCKICGKEILPKSNRQQYCNDCYISHEKERKRKVWHKIKYKYKN
jgi:hypothetical protein